MRRYRQVREYSPWNEPNLADRTRRTTTRGGSRRTTARCARCARAARCSAPTSSTTRAWSSWMRAYLKVFAPGTGAEAVGPAQLRRRELDLALGHARRCCASRRASSGSPRPARSSAARSRRRPSDGDRRLLIRTGPAPRGRRDQAGLQLARDEPAGLARLHLPLAREPRTSWDSALVTANGTLRPSFDIFASQARLAHAAARPARAAGSQSRRAPAAARRGEAVRRAGRRP